MIRKVVFKTYAQDQLSLLPPNYDKLIPLNHPVRVVNSNPFHPDQLYYNKQTDAYYCPMGQAMTCIGSYKKKTKNGFEQEIHRYQAQNCESCPLRSRCHQSKYNRIIERNYNLIRLKSKARKQLTSEQGIAKRKQRCWDVEAVFGNIKQNMNFKRFMLRGIDKVNVEIGLVAMAHNLKKYSLTI